MKIMLIIKCLSLGFFLHHSSSLDKETKAAYDNYNSSSSFLFEKEVDPHSDLI